MNLNKVLRYGFRIGAEQALILDGELSRYYKKGDRASKYCLYSYTDHRNGRPLRWEIAWIYDVSQVVDFYKKTMGKSVELIPIPNELPEKEGEQI
ncbi:hypothetical protein [Acinetobacter sp. CFCC 10889]|uniref:hypothetical protein n=1 Tax=Acinetobacter sp. CFCC 10889 TaxID=1775557 RepID=UPI001D17E7EA|nr:hypothetical protein [Acinetobacter sp. CFCC 10889]